MNTLEDIRRQVLDIKCKVLKDYLDDLENALKEKQKDFGVLSLLENQTQDDPDNFEDSIIKGVNDWLYRSPMRYLESEITKSKYEYSIALAELLGLEQNTESKYDIDRIKEIPILDFISRFTIIRNNNQAICPIHREKTPSMHIYENTNSWYCFGCNKGGSIIDFMMELNQYSINEALDDLSKLI